MFMPHDKTGYIAPTGPDEGGHAWLIIGANRNRGNPDRTKGAIRMINSWGDSWGSQRGRAWITFRDLDKLIQDDGEACVASEVIARARAGGEAKWPDRHGSRVKA